MSLLRVREISQIWTMLRQPFVLPRACFGHHECRWERLDLDVLGCVLCGSVHACADGACGDVQEVEDGHVCTLSGVLVRDRRFVQTEFLPHANLTETVAAHCVFDEETAHGDVEQVVHSVLCSETARKLFLRNMVYRMNRSKHRLRREPNLVVGVAKLVSECGLAQPLRDFEAPLRAAVAARAIRAILAALNRLVHNLRMPLKDGDLQTVAVGMLFLMRQGVFFEDVVVLPQERELEHMLPPEGMLSTVFGIAGKTITESENRVKFALRSATRARLCSMGFRLRAGG